jgi:nucleotide-binding universal stress UspA family protein
MYSNILVPIDTSYKSGAWAKPSLRKAWEIAEKSGARIHVLSVIPDNLLKGYYPDVYTEEFAGETKKKLEAIVKEDLPSDARVEVNVAQGGICTEILREARKLPADVIVMASHGPLTRDYILGSNATHVALHAPCSVFIVRETEEASE